jgi:hypothetical protein
VRPGIESFRPAKIVVVLLFAAIPVTLLAEYGNTKPQSDSACVAALTKPA